MNLLYIKEQILNLPESFIRDLVSKDELVEYTEGMASKDIDGELVRSYLIVYKDGINIVWNKLRKIYEEYKGAELTDIIKISIEEALEEVNFDKLFLTEIHDIKNS
jgi:hypothetical protein